MPWFQQSQGGLCHFSVRLHIHLVAGFVGQARYVCHGSNKARAGFVILAYVCIFIKWRASSGRPDMVAMVYGTLAGLLFLLQGIEKLYPIERIQEGIGDRLVFVVLGIRPLIKGVSLVLGAIRGCSS